MRKYIYMVLSVLVLAAFSASAQPDKRDVRRGNRDFKKENFKEAEIEYRKGALKDSLSVAANYNLAASLYRQGNYGESKTVLEKIKDVAPASDNAADYYYNLGDVAIANQDWQAAVDAFEQSLLRNPADLDAKENYIYARMKLQKEQEQQQSQRQDEHRSGPHHGAHIQRFARHGLDIALAGVEFRINEEKAEIDEGRHHGGGHDVHIRDTREAAHHKHGSAHDRGQYLPAAGSGRFDGGGLFRRVIGLLHQRDGEGAGHGDVRHRAARDGTEQSAGKNGQRGRAAAEVARRPVADAHDELETAERLKEGTENNEQEQIVGREDEQTSVQAPRRGHIGREQGDHALKVHAGRTQCPGQM